MTRISLIAVVVVFCAIGLLGQNSSGASSGNGSAQEPDQDKDIPFYRVGSGVSPPRVIFHVDPEYTDKARKAKKRGTVVLQMVVGADGLTHDVKVDQALDSELDAQAVKAVQQWKFEPAQKDGKPIAVRIKVQVDFKLY